MDFIVEYEMRPTLAGEYEAQVSTGVSFIFWVDGQSMHTLLLMSYIMGHVAFTALEDESNVAKFINHSCQPNSRFEKWYNQ